ncbi:hypothetical protein R3P38DRAFT_3179348 [Favolaschia claudopus]|uniref:Uncharacterized protein n=1 Tax=Favolaschia claudopus TaxID=2862362 RepID=A0AAW0CWC5_9AGAR
MRICGLLAFCAVAFIPVAHCEEDLNLDARGFFLTITLSTAATVVPPAVTNTIPGSSPLGPNPTPRPISSTQTQEIQSSSSLASDTKPPPSSTPSFKSSPPRESQSSITESPSETSIIIPQSPSVSSSSFSPHDASPTPTISAPPHASQHNGGKTHITMIITVSVVFTALFTTAVALFLIHRRRRNRQRRYHAPTPYPETGVGESQAGQSGHDEGEQCAGAAESQRPSATTNSRSIREKRNSKTPPSDSIAAAPARNRDGDQIDSHPPQAGVEAHAAACGTSRAPTPAVSHSTDDLPPPYIDTPSLL